MNRGLGLVRILALPAVLITAWWFVSANSSNFFFPPLSEILSTFVDEWIGPRLLDDVLPSVLRLAAGYSIALVVGIAVGVAVGRGPRLRAAAEPVLEFFRAIPPPVLVPILTLIAGIGDGPKVTVIALGCVWPILLNTVEGVRGLDDVLDETAQCYQLTGVNRLRYLLLPAASPQIVVGARQALSIGIILMVISELVGATNGLGFAVVQFQRGFALPEMWSGIIMLGLLGVALSFLFRLVERRLLSWYFGIRLAQRGRGA